MRKSLFAVAALATLGAMGGASAGHETEIVTLVDVDMTAGVPGFYGPHELYDFGLDQDVRIDCPADGALNGIAGTTFAVPADAAGRPGAMTLSGDTALDADVYWYDDNCLWIDDTTWAAKLAPLDEDAGNESGTIPENAAFGTINFTLGVEGHAKLVYERIVQH